MNAGAHDCRGDDMLDLNPPFRAIRRRDGYLPLEEPKPE
jgi:hypothetical protein